jgi:serine/threonine-protein kinase RsbW
MPPEVISLSMPSRLELLAVVDTLVEGLARHLRFDEATAEAVTISSIEAATNAIQHGHSRDPKKRVSIEFEYGGAVIEVRVRDYGPGFDPGDLLDPTDPENILRVRGRGIHIMRSLMDEVTFDFPDGDGTLVRMRKRIPVPVEPL